MMMYATDENFQTLRALPENQIQTQTVCLAPHIDKEGKKCFYRARIEEVYPTQRVKVFFFDYGNVEMIPFKDLFILPDE